MSSAVEPRLKQGYFVCVCVSVCHGHDHGQFIWMNKISDGPASNLVHVCVSVLIRIASVSRAVEHRIKQEYFIQLCVHKKLGYSKRSLFSETCFPN